MGVGVDFSHSGYEWYAGVAYIACPKDIDREEYIQDCHMNYRVSVKTEDGGYYNRVPVSMDIFPHLYFPKNDDELGTAVVFVTEPKHKQPIIIARLPKTDEIGDIREGLFRGGKKEGQKSAEIFSSAKEGFLHFNVEAGDRQGRVEFSLDNDEDDCIFNIDVAGNIIIEATKSTYIHNEQEFTSIVTEGDESDLELSIIRQTKDRTLIGGSHVVLNGRDIEIVHYKGYKVIVNEDGITIDALDKDITINSGESSIKMEDGRVDIEASKIGINGSFEVLYNKTPGLPITDISQIGISKKVTVG